VFAEEYNVLQRLLLMDNVQLMGMLTKKKKQFCTNGGRWQE